MPRKPLDESYFTWLYSQVTNIKTENPNRTYWGILKKLYSTEYIWYIRNDENRADDGKDLRREFSESERVRIQDQAWLQLPCSILEMMIALARKFAFEFGGDPKACFWMFMEHLELDHYNDSTPIVDEVVDDILKQFIFRTYDADGHGGLFPLENPDQDQRDVELWYQMQAYLIEMG